VASGIDQSFRTNPAPGVAELHSCTILPPPTEAPSLEFQLPDRYLRTRRVVDVSIILLLSPLVLVICLVVAVLIHLDSQGPVLFRQARPGKNGEIFLMLKFRTMRLSSDSSCRLTATSDARLTRVGAFLRRHRLDELPQLWNVLRGQMSLIGPRPEPVFLSRHLEECIPLYSYRRVVLPGITGLAQVELGYTEGIEDCRAKVKYDLYYISHLSVRLDVEILLGTFRTIVTGRGAR